MAQDTEPVIDPDSPDYFPPKSTIDQNRADRHHALERQSEQKKEANENAAAAIRRQLDQWFDHQPVAGHDGDEHEI